MRGELGGGEGATGITPAYPLSTLRAAGCIDGLILRPENSHAGKLLESPRMTRQRETVVFLDASVFNFSSTLPPIVG